jgi:hypothetical protein
VPSGSSVSQSSSKADFAVDHDPLFCSALDLRERIRTLRLSSVEVTEAVLHRIEQTQPTLNAFITQGLTCLLLGQLRGFRRPTADLAKPKYDELERRYHL